MPLAISAITNSFASHRPESKSLSDVRTSFLSPGCKPDCVREWSLNLLLKIELPFLVPVCGNCIQGVPSTFYIPAVKVNNYPTTIKNGVCESESFGFSIIALYSSGRDGINERAGSLSIKREGADVQPTQTINCFYSIYFDWILSRVARSLY